MCYNMSSSITPGHSSTCSVVKRHFVIFDIHYPCILFDIHYPWRMSVKTDAFAFGVVCFELLTGRTFSVCGIVCSLHTICLFAIGDSPLNDLIDSVTEAVEQDDASAKAEAVKNSRRLWGRSSTSEDDAGASALGKLLDKNVGNGISKRPES